MKGHLFILCGPPGAGKTTLLKMLNEIKLPLHQIQRITTRKPRKEEGDTSLSSIEYRFLSLPEFSKEIAENNISNLIEWNGNYYATNIDLINNLLEEGKHCLLFEDIPSSIVLKKYFGTSSTVLFLFPDSKDKLLKLNYTDALSGKIKNQGAINEWCYRLQLKFLADAKVNNTEVSEAKLNEYIQKKIKRAIPDIAFITGKIRTGEDIFVLENLRDKQQKTLKTFIDIFHSVINKNVTKDYHGSYVFVLMPFKDEFNKLYRFVIKPSIEREGLSVLRGDEIFNKLDIVEDIMNHIENASIIVSDITGGNPNVFLELGVSIKLNKPIVLLTQDSEAPFDVKNCRWIKYQDTLEGWELLSSQLTEVIRKVKHREKIH